MSQTSRKKSIIIIGGSKLQVPVIQWAKELGLYVVVTDKNPQVPGVNLADEFHNIEGTEIPKFLDLARNLSTKYDLVGAYGGSDFALPTVAAVAEAFDLPYSSLASVKLALDKTAAKQRWLKAGVKTPAFRAVTTLGEARDAVAALGLPAVIKPVDASGSRGVTTINDISMLESAFKKAREFSKYILIELYLRGRHIDVNGLFWDGQFYKCGTDERFFTPEPLRIPIWLYQPARLSEDEEEACYQALETAASALGINCGPVKGDFILTEGGPVILEIAPRFHGEVTTVYVTPVALKMNPIKAYFSAMCGLPFTDQLVPKLNGIAGWHAVFPEPGKVNSISGMEQVENFPGTYDLFLKLKQGDRVKQHFDNQTVAGFIWAAQPSVSKLQMNLQKAVELLAIDIQT